MKSNTAHSTSKFISTWQIHSDFLIKKTLKKKPVKETLKKRRVFYLLAFSISYPPPYSLMEMGETAATTRLADLA